MPETEWMTLRETADLMKKLPDQVTQMCEDGKLEYYMEDGRHFVSRESIDLFMNPPIGQPAPANPDSNGTPRRQYGRAPHESAPSPESASDSQAVNGTDEVDAASGSEPENSMVETPGRGDDVAETAENVQPAEDVQRPQVAGHSEENELQMEPVVDAAPTGEVLPGENADPVPSIQDGAQAEAAEDAGEPDVRAAKILANLRAALSRHAREHNAFCDEIAALVDALDSTLSRDGDKTSELTREISNLLSRYTRR